LGSVSATYSGGTAPISYSWGDISGAPLNRTNLGAGLYTITVTDANECVASATGAVYSLSGATVEILTFSGPSCYNGNNGIIEVSVSGGEGTPVISWLRNNVLLPGLDTTSYFDLSAGSYRVVATDALNCSAYAEVILENPLAITGDISVIQEVSCFGDADGILSASATGGTGELTFNWTAEGSSPVIENLSAGVYSLSISDESGCSVMYDFTLTQPEILTQNALVTDLSCYGTSDGSIEIFADGGTAPYTYLWNDVNGSATLSDLVAGTYSVVLQDARNCLSSSDIVISEPTALEISMTSGPLICYGASTGVLSVSANGATPPYQYLWSGPVEITDDSQAELFDLPAGDYVVEVMDANGCSAIAGGSISESDLIVVNADIVDATCLNPLGSASATVYGGTSPYSVGWYNSAGDLISNLDSVENLAPGDDSIIVSDFNDCPGLVSFGISEDVNLNISLQTNNISCFGNADGAITAVLLNGVAPYQYDWSNGAYTAVNSGLSEGEYFVTVTDASGCSNSASATLTMPGLITAYIDSTSNATCNGSSNGYASVVVVGGTAPFYYLWNNEFFGPVRNDLSADTFEIIVTDDMGCSVSLNDVIISEPSAIEVTIESADQSCVAENGSITLSVNGGVAPYDAVWNNGENGLAIFNLTSGNYSAILTDANGCEVDVNQMLDTYCYETQLTAQYCSTPPASVSLQDNIQCGFIEGATTYTWFFYNNGLMLGSANSTSTIFPVANIPGVFPGALIGVKVNVVVEGLEYSGNSDCYIQIESLETTQLLAEDCNAVISDSSYVLNCEPMQDATQYSWIIEGSSVIDTIYTADALLVISDISDLEANQSYTVTISYNTADGFASEPGDPCTITMLINTDTSTAVNRPIDIREFMLYPNPGDGISLVVKNAPDNGKMRVCDTAGRTLYTFETRPASLGAQQSYTMPYELPQGVYIIGFDNGITRSWVVR